MIFATDLDRTMIFSKRCTGGDASSVCVEWKDGQEISYMTKKSVSILQSLQNRAVVIPVTARSKEQFDRVIPFRDSHYAITGNGTSIWKDGTEMEEWRQTVCQVRLQEKDRYAAAWTFLSKCNLEKPPVLIDQTFLFAKLYPDTSEEISEEIKDWVSSIGWNLVVQGRKVYLMPAEISKEHALEWLIARLPQQPVLTAGDDAGDYLFMKLGEAITPKGSELSLQNPELRRTIKCGIHAGEEILCSVYERSLNEIQ